MDRLILIVGRARATSEGTAKTGRVIHEHVVVHGDARTIDTNNVLRSANVVDMIV